MQTDGLYGTSGIYKIVNQESGKCLESNLNYSGNGTPVQLWACYGDPGNQQWREVRVPSSIYQPLPEAQFVNMLTGQCLDADLGNINNNGARLQQWSCWNDPGNARFLIAG
jgi:glucosylceramidase